MGKNREEERRVGSDGVLIATPARTTSTARGTIETRVAGSFGNVAQCLVFLLDAAACPPARVSAAAASPHPFIPLVVLTIHPRITQPRICDLAEHAPGDRASLTLALPHALVRFLSVLVLPLPENLFVVATASCLPAFV